MRSDELPIDQVIREERALLGLDPEELRPTGIGLALSGGGIRSASFALGVVQHLVGALNRGLETFHYLSTVSGGGYMGTAISWLRHHYKGAFQEQLGSKHWGDRSAELRGLASTRPVKAQKAPPKTWLDYARMHGNYLLPCRIRVLSLIGVGLRGLVFTVTIYGGAAVALLAILSDIGVLPPSCAERCAREPWFGIDRWLSLSAGLLGLQVLLYGVGSWLTSVPVLLAAPTIVLIIAGGLFALHELISFLLSDAAARWPYVLAPAVATLVCFLAALRVLVGALTGPAPVQRQIRSWSYELRTWAQRRLGAMLGMFLALLILRSVPSVYDWLFYKTSWAPAAVGGGSALLTGVVTILKFLTGKKKNPNPSFLDRSLSALAPVVGAVAVIYGGLILAYGVQKGGWHLPPCPCVWMAPQMSLAIAGMLLAGVLVLGFFCNVNYLSLGRMYRDRLMEMFMPGKHAIDTMQWMPASQAEGLLISELLADLKLSPSLFHLVCCNIVLRDARRDSFRGRAGDSFAFSPLYSGSTATGWTRSDWVGEGGMSLATAMATSGAAANPDAAVAGAGFTRNRFVAFLMWIFNVRLGYWLRNPRDVSKRSRAVRWPPNFWIPGLWQGLLGRSLAEDARYIDLSDGGHFDNTALYELIRRRVGVIVLAEAGADPNYVMDDLANAIERVRADFGVHIRFDIEGFEPERIRPQRMGWRGRDGKCERYAARGYALGTIRYPKLSRGPEESPARRPGAAQPADWKDFDTGYLLYLQATRVRGIRDRIDVDSYARVHPDFPNESTANQFFDEDQLEAYRELGMEVTQQAFREIFNPQERTDEADRLAQELGVR